MKYCKNCGKELKDDAKFCPKCGSVVPVQEKSENYEKNEAKNIPPVSDTEKPPRSFCKNCGAPLREGVKFCHKCGSPVSAPVEHDIKQDLESPDNLNIYPPSSIKSDKTKFSQATQEETDKIKASKISDNLANKDNAAEKELKNKYPPLAEYPQVTESKVHKSKILPLLYGIIPVLIVAGIAVFLYTTNRLPFISQTNTNQKQTSLKREKGSAKKPPSVKTKKKIKPAKVASLNKSKTKTVKKGITFVYPKKILRSPVSPSLAPPQANTYRPPAQVYHVNHVKIAFNTLRTNFNSAQAKLISYVPEHVSGQSSINFVVLSHVYSFASNISTNSIEMFKVEFRAAIPQNLNAASVKIVSKIGGQEGFGAANISFINLSSSGVYTIGIPVKIPAYFMTGNYYFNAEVEALGMFLTSNNAYFRVK